VETLKDKRQDVLKKLFSKREENIKNALNWNLWDIEDQLERAKTAKEGFLTKDSNYDTSIINEHIDQLTQSLKLKQSNSASDTTH
jgi:hypothetical protein